MTPCSSCALVFTFATCALLTVSGGLLVAYFPSYLQEIIKKHQILDKPTSSPYHTFQNTSAVVDVYINFYLWNCTNSWEVASIGAHPIMQQVGPYVYLAVMYKGESNISWHPDGTISYTYHQLFTFQQDRTFPLTEDDIVITWNLGLLGAIFRVDDFSVALDFINLCALLTNSSLFVNITAKQLFFGYENPLLKVLQEIFPTIISNPNITVEKQDDPISWSKLTSAYTGATKVSDDFTNPPANSAQRLISWAGFDLLPYWDSPFANAINGTDGSMFWPGITQQDRPYCFVDVLYRSVLLSSTGTRHRDGIKVITFNIDHTNMQSPEQNPDNVAFGMTLQGFLPRPRSFGEPVVMSKPGFLGCNLSFVHVVQFPTFPDSSAQVAAYDTYLDVEPITGYLFSARKKLQMSTWIQQVPEITALNVSRPWTFVPIVWIEEAVDVPQNLIDNFNRDVMLPLHLARYGGIALSSTGSVGFVLLALFIVVRQRRLRGADVSQGLVQR